MNVEEIRAYALLKENVEEGFPFGEETLVFKTNGKIFLLMGLDNTETSFNVKCDPDKAIELREGYPDNILPGYHMNKKHWNTVMVHGLKSGFIKEMIDHSYSLLQPKKKTKK
ncbi:MAG: MmcQ/YjbR family DNA-binding protein [Sphingobacteriales bacterium]|nr:MAG: MmcQ/YjbR family DNA-binding protein [Sphingobacteriales bacterium]